MPLALNDTIINILIKILDENMIGTIIREEYYETL